MTNGGATRVVKVGGSLFGWPDLVPRLRHWLLSPGSPTEREGAAPAGPCADRGAAGASPSRPDIACTAQRATGREAATRTVLIAGGGAFAEALRQLDAQYCLGEEPAHWLCIEALRVSARLLAQLLPECPLVADWHDLQMRLRTADGPGAWVLCPQQFLREVEAEADDHPLPPSWQVTSDSIAARVAELLPARELILLKSAAPPERWRSDPAYVDGHFERAAERLPVVRAVNLRAVQLRA